MLNDRFNINVESDTKFIKTPDHDRKLWKVRQVFCLS